MNFVKEYIKGYNHAAQIARLAFKNTKYPILPFAIRKKFITKKQAGSSRSERLQNMHGVFHTTRQYDIRNKNVLLVDDIITTGATIDECTKVLLQNGVKDVYVLTFAKSIKDEEAFKEKTES